MIAKIDPNSEGEHYPALEPTINALVDWVNQQEQNPIKSLVPGTIAPTSWKKELEKQINRKQINDFVQNLLKEVIDEIPESVDLADMDYPFEGMDKLKQSLIKCYLDSQ